MTDTTTMAEAALRRLRHSIATSAGMHKLQIRRQAAAMRAEQLPHRVVFRVVIPAGAIDSDGCAEVRIATETPWTPA